MRLFLLVCLPLSWWVLLLACSQSAPSAESSTQTTSSASQSDKESSQKDLPQNAEADHTDAAPPGAVTSALPSHNRPHDPESDYLMGKFSPQARPDFVQVKQPYTTKSGMLLRKEAFAAFEKMWAAAKAEGINLYIISATRTFSQQKAIWEGKWTRYAGRYPDPKERALKILEYSSMPGSSRHHWGTDVDLNDLNNEAFEKGGKHEKVYTWLLAHAHEYGYCQPYTAGRPHGYYEEKWHWSYAPLSRPLLSTYAKTVNDAVYSGFQGAETAAQIQIVKHYVLGVNTACSGQ